MDPAPKAAAFHRFVLIASLLGVLVSVAASGLDLRPQVALQDGVLVTDFNAVDFEGSDIIDFLESGGTLRFTWQIREDRREAAVVRYARRDPLGEGYFVLDSEGEPLSGPFQREVFIGEIVTLRGLPLDRFAVGESPATLEVRLVIDRDSRTAPLDRGKIPGIDEERSPWRRVRMPGEGSE